MDKETKANNQFICTDGTKLETINDLIIELERNARGDSQTLKFHTRDDQNDYANWLKSEFGLFELAEKIMNIKDAKEMLNIINDYFNNNSNDNFEEKENKEEVKTIDVNDPQLLEVKKSLDLISKSSEDKLDLVEEIKKNSLKKSDKMQQEVELIKNEYSEVYNEISQARKQGKDMFIPELKLKNVKPKIQFFEASRNVEDYEKIKLLIEDIRKEIADEANHKPLNVKEEILAASKEETNS